MARNVCCALDLLCFAGLSDAGNGVFFFFFTFFLFGFLPFSSDDEDEVDDDEDDDDDELDEDELDEEDDESDLVLEPCFPATTVTVWYRNPRSLSLMSMIFVALRPFFVFMWLFIASRIQYTHSFSLSQFVRNRQTAERRCGFRMIF